LHIKGFEQPATSIDWRHNFSNYCIVVIFKQLKSIIMNSGKVILGIIAGASIGAMAGILLAPDKGSATRKKIVEHTNDLRSILNDWATDFIDIMKGNDVDAGTSNYAKDENDGSPGMNLNTMG
jgi:YtxH-like protein